MDFKKTMDKAIRMCDNKFKPGDLVRYHNSIIKIISSNEDKGTYSLVDVLGGGEALYYPTELIMKVKRFLKSPKVFLQTNGEANGKYLEKMEKIGVQKV